MQQLTRGATNVSMAAQCRGSSPPLSPLTSHASYTGTGGWETGPLVRQNCGSGTRVQQRRAACARPRTLCTYLHSIGTEMATALREGQFRGHTYGAVVWLNEEPPNIATRRVVSGFPTPGKCGARSVVITLLTQFNLGMRKKAGGGQGGEQKRKDSPSRRAVGYGRSFEHSVHVLLR
jgi:hypothetical protein